MDKPSALFRLPAKALLCNFTKSRPVNHPLYSVLYNVQQSPLRNVKIIIYATRRVDGIMTDSQTIKCASFVLA